MIYFLYKNLQGLHPKSNTIGIGLASYGEFTVGSVQNIGELDKVREFSPIIISEDLLNGIKIINIESGVTLGIDDEIITLTAEQILLQNEAKIFFKKLEIRKNIQNVIGDTEDQLADVSKRLALLERLAVRILLPIMKGEAIPVELVTAYQPMLEAIITAVDNGTAKDRVDLEDPTAQMNSIMTKSTQISDIVEEYITYKNSFDV